MIGDVNGGEWGGSRGGVGNEPYFRYLLVVFPVNMI